MKPRARQLFKYVNKVYGIFQSFAKISDGHLESAFLCHGAKASQL